MAILCELASISAVSFGLGFSDSIKGPNELLLLSSDGIPAIHSSKSKCTKRNAGIYNVIHYKGERNIDAILDPEEHRPRRQVWERAMSTKGKSVFTTLLAHVVPLSFQNAMVA